MVSNPLRILHVVIDVAGGAVEYVRRLIEARGPGIVAQAAVLPLGRRVPGGVAQTLSASGASVVTLPALAGVTSLPRCLLALTRAARHADVIVTHTGPAGLIGRLAAAIAGRPCVHVAHNWPGATPSGPIRHLALDLSDRLLAPLAVAVACPSDAVRDDGLAHGWARPGRAPVIRYALDLQRFAQVIAPDRTAARIRLGLDPTAELVVFAGRLDPIKGVDVLAEAATRVAALRPGCTILVAGDGPEQARIAAVAGPTLRLLGWRSDVPLLLQAADIVVVPSRQEALGIVCLEAMAVGTPVVASAVGGIPEALGDAGVLVPAEDPAALAEALARLMADVPRRELLTAAGRQRIGAMYSGDAWVRAYERLWRQVAA